MGRVNRYSPEVRQRAVRLLAESLPSHHSEWAATVSVAEKTGCTPEALRKWACQRQVHRGQRSGASTEQQDRLRQLVPGSMKLKGPGAQEIDAPKQIGSKEQEQFALTPVSELSL